MNDSSGKSTAATGTKRSSPATAIGIGLLLAALLWPAAAYPHGGVAFEDDQCVISIGFLRAHFAVFQPERRGSREYCEDVPTVARAVFILEYRHDLLRRMAVDFRIIRDVTGFGRFANWGDIQAIADIEAVTVHYQPPQVEGSGYFRAGYAFQRGGDYIGIVTARHPDNGRLYNAVFYFQVGGLGTPLLLALGLLGALGGGLAIAAYRANRRRRLAIGSVVV